MNQVKRLPPGWDTKCEPRSGRRHVTLEDPRNKEQPDGNSAAQENGRATRHVPLMGASAVQSNNSNNNPNNQTIMAETVNKIRSMFPTVPETHIKALLLKYHGREAVVVSALQVEKHPVATPGPFTPPPGRPTPRPLAPLACRPQPKPHSPKMKLRYLKSVFPVVEETVLLDTLCSADNNVTHATERLINLGFSKRDTPPPRISLKKAESEPTKATVKKAPSPPRIKSAEEKETIKKRICQKHPEVAEKVVSIALESAAFNEETAETILALMIEEKPSKPKDACEEVVESPKIIREEAEVKTEAVPISPILIDYKSLKKRQKGKLEERQVLKKEMHIRIVKEDDQNKNSAFESPLLTKPQGPNCELISGPDESLLLEDYVPWIGAQRGLAKGQNKMLSLGTRGALGPDLSIRKGPQCSLAKGSIYSNFLGNNESRGN
ncbi:uncharacterized protein isoform X3 [Rhodnius prolixus]|uniref:uncharacterized protein isoform X3 n=1 Tax=Rhodnius prolixus TaxID=13249 RepID=UPI003D18A7C9